MKKLSSCLFVAGILLVPFRGAWAQRLFGEDDRFWIFQEIKVPTDTLPANKALSALSQTAPLNIFIDAAALPANAEVLPYAKRPFDPFEAHGGARSAVVTNIASQLQLSYDRTAVNTVVFWRQPDIQRTINLIVGRQKQLSTLYPTADEENATLKSLQPFFDPELKETPPLTKEDEQKQITHLHIGPPEPMNGEPQSAQKAVSVAQLPPELRIALQSDFVRRLRLQNASPDYNQLELPAWKDARVRFVKQQYNIYDETMYARKQEQVFVGRVDFPHQPISKGSFIYTTPQPAYIGASHADNPHQVDFPNFAPPAWLTQGERLAQFRAEDLPPRPAPLDLPPALDLNADEALAKTVKFSAARVPLADFVADLARQGGVALTVAPDIAPQAQVMAFSSGMKLGEALTALERLYGARWTKGDAGYLLRSQGLDEMHTTLNQWGLATVYKRKLQTSPKRDALGAQLADEVSGAFDQSELRSKAGVAFSELPPDTQSHILQVDREDRLGRLLVTQGRLEEALAFIDNFSIRYGSLPENVPTLFGAFHAQEADTGFFEGKQAGLAAYTPDGRFITRLFGDFNTFQNALTPAPQFELMPPGFSPPGLDSPPGTIWRRRAVTWAKAPVEGTAP